MAECPSRPPSSGGLPSPLRALALALAPRATTKHLPTSLSLLRTLCGPRELGLLLGRRQATAIATESRGGG
ncbi:hypothetical protein NL676_002057 [Syzygium grande]|nr:hypothetical protein NL676_002057 [Syzygium grande]